MLMSMAQILPVSSTVEVVEVTRRASCGPGLPKTLPTDVASPVQRLWRENQANKPIANEHGLPRPDSARFEHGGGSRSNTKGEYVVLVCQKHYLPT